jgi:hypothetical protein
MVRLPLTLNNEDDSSCTSSLENQAMLSAHVVRLTPFRPFAAVDPSCSDKPVLQFASTPQLLGLSQWPSLLVLSVFFLDMTRSVAGGVLHESGSR